MRKTIFADQEKYHLFNRGVDKRKIFQDQFDLERFFKSMHMFNSVNPIGSLYEQGFSKKEKEQNEPLVKFIAFCLLPNHFHFIVEQLVEGGISEYMKRLLGGYTWYFNNRHKRAGALFQGAFKRSILNPMSNFFMSVLT